MNLNPLTLAHILIQGFRWCDYYGKYFCRSCHSNSKTIIPARVIFDWDFSHYLVSQLAQTFIVSIWTEPVFDIAILNDGKLLTTIDSVKSANSLRANISLQMSDIMRSHPMFLTVPI